LKHIFITIIALSLIVGCGSRVSSQSPVLEKKPQHKQVVTQNKLPPTPKKTFTPKEVKDTNYADNYMYPEDGSAAKKDPSEKTKTTENISNTMTKEECISMISQEKFDKYTKMFGSEASSIKRCSMLKAMKK